MREVELILASVGEHGVRPYANVVGANSSCDRMSYMTFAHASTTNGTQTITLERRVKSCPQS